MGEYEPNDSRNVTGTASTPDGRWTGQAANDPSITDAQLQGQQGFTAQDAANSGQMQQSGQSIGQSGEGVGGAASQGNDHTSAIGQNQSAGAAGSGQASYGNSGQGMSQPQQFQDRSRQQGSGGDVGGNVGGNVGGAGQFASQIAKHQEVVDVDGRHVGTVDHIDGDRIKLTRQDSADGEHHDVALSEVAGIEQGRVRLSGSGSAGSGGAL
jgi:hypothetical protein